MIAVTTFYSPKYKPLADITLHPLQKWCDKHGYYFNVRVVDDGNVDFQITKDALGLLESGYDVVMAIECDILVTNLNYKVQDFIDNEHDFFICKDVNNVNFGCWIATGKSVLEFILGQKENFKTEQNVLEHFNQLPSVKYLPHPSINSIPYQYYHNFGYINYNGQEKPTKSMGDWDVDCFNCHLPGKPLEERISIFNEIKQHIIYE